MSITLHELQLTARLNEQRLQALSELSSKSPECNEHKGMPSSYSPAAQSNATYVMSLPCTAKQLAERTVRCEAWYVLHL